MCDRGTIAFGQICKSEYCITACLAQLEWRLVCHGVIDQWQIALCFWVKTISHKVADHDSGYKVPALSVWDRKGKVLVIMPQEKTQCHLYSLSEYNSCCWNSEQVCQIQFHKKSQMGRITQWESLGRCQKVLEGCAVPNVTKVKILTKVKTMSRNDPKVRRASSSIEREEMLVVSSWSMSSW